MNKNQKFKLIGKKIIKNKDRAPTISFTVDGMTSKEVSKMLTDNNIATRNDNFYAWRCLTSLGINTDDGVIRISMTHYNKKEEVDKLIKVLSKI